MKDMEEITIKAYGYADYIEDYLKFVQMDYMRAVSAGCNILSEDFKEQAKPYTRLYNNLEEYEEIDDKANRLIGYLERHPDKHILDKLDIGEKKTPISHFIPEGRDKEDFCYKQEWQTVLALIGTKQSAAVSRLLVKISDIKRTLRKREQSQTPTEEQAKEEIIVSKEFADLFIADGKKNKTEQAKEFIRECIGNSNDEVIDLYLKWESNRKVISLQRKQTVFFEELKERGLFSYKTIENFGQRLKIARNKQERRKQSVL